MYLSTEIERGILRMGWKGKIYQRRKLRGNRERMVSARLQVRGILLADIFSLHLVERWIVALTPNCSCLTERGIDAIHFLFPSISSEARSCQEAPGIRRRRHYQARGRFWRGRQRRKQRRIEKHSFDRYLGNIQNRFCHEYPLARQVECLAAIGAQTLFRRVVARKRTIEEGYVPRGQLLFRSSPGKVGTHESVDQRFFHPKLRWLVQKLFSELSFEIASRFW